MLPVETRRMNRMLWDHPMQALREMDNVLNHVFSNGQSSDSSLGFYPTDIREDENHVYVEAELPGFSKDQIEVTIENGVLSIMAQRNTEETKGQKHLTERRYAQVARRFSLPKTVDENKVEAQLKDGVLYLTLHKREDVKPRKIEVK